MAPAPPASHGARDWALSRRRHIEADQHRAVVQFLELARPACVWYHVPNGEKRDAKTAALLKGMGLRPGVFDFTFEAFRFVGHIDIKAPGEKLSKAQEAFAADCKVYGIPCAIAFEVVDVHDLLVSWGLLRPGRYEFIRKPDLIRGVTT